jgi:hypothetical protein
MRKENLRMKAKNALAAFFFTLNRAIDEVNRGIAAGN